MARFLPLFGPLAWRPERPRFWFIVTLLNQSWIAWYCGGERSSSPPKLATITTDTSLADSFRPAGTAPFAGNDEKLEREIRSDSSHCLYTRPRGLLEGRRLPFVRGLVPSPSLCTMSKLFRSTALTQFFAPFP